MSGVTLIGMPGVGKSTIGKLLAEKLKFRFLDLDLYIRDHEGQSIVNIIEDIGEDEFLKLEENRTLELDLASVVFAPGGSIIYSPTAVAKIRQETEVFYLALPLAAIQQRLGDKLHQRGIVGLQKGLTKLYAEREPLYKAAAHYQIDCNNRSDNEIVAAIIAKYNVGR